MERIIEYIVLCLILPIALLCFLLENRARKIMMSVCFGILACLLAYYLNTNLIALLKIDDKYYSTTFAPIVEETLKFIPISILILVLKKGHRGSIANAFAVGVGFCIVENFYYLFNFIETANFAWVIARCISTGLMHSMSAVLIGVGTYYARKDKGMRVFGILASLFTAFMYHGMYNLLVDSQSFMIVGLSIPAVTFIIVLIIIKTGKTLELFSDTNNVQTDDNTINQ